MAHLLSQPGQCLCHIGYATVSIQLPDLLNLLQAAMGCDEGNLCFRADQVGRGKFILTTESIALALSAHTLGMQLSVSGIVVCWR